MKTKQELDEIRQDCINLQNKLKQLSDEELKQVTGGNAADQLVFNSYITLATAMFAIKNGNVDDKLDSKIFVPNKL